MAEPAIRSAVTISLVPEAKGGPFVYWDGLEHGVRSAAGAGFDAVEIFPPGPEVFEGEQVANLLARHNLRLAAVGTGAGWLKHRLTLTSADVGERKQAIEFVRSVIDAAARFGAPAIIGSMQGRWGGDVSQDVAIKHLRDALNALAEHAGGRGVRLLYEPLNRYETNVCNTMDEGCKLLNSLTTQNVKLLADLYHMNIEEESLPAALRTASGAVGHVHLADSNRRPAGFGHTNFGPIAAALRSIGYSGYVSAECLPYPDSDAAARRTMTAFNHYFRNA
jgi:sugar phosphate isomerase/epimerase